MSIPPSAIVALINVAITLFEKITQLIAIARQRGELTAQQETDFENRMLTAFEAPHWKSRRK